MPLFLQKWLINSAKRNLPAWIWLTGLALVFLIRFPAHFLLHPPYLMDFEVYRAVAVRIAQGEAHELYAPTTSELMMFKYAPAWALAWRPLAWCPAAPAAILWSALTVGWLAGACWGVARLVRDAGLRLSWWMMPAAVVLLVRPITAEFLNGQVDLLWALLVIGFLMAWMKHRHVWAGAWLALAISLKLPAGLFVPYLLATRSWRTAAWTCLMLAGLNLAACAALTPDQPLALLHAWARVLLSSGASRAFEIGNQSLLALAGRFLSADAYRLNIAALPLGAVGLLVLGVSVALWSVTLRTPSAPRSGQARAVFDGALLTILMVLCSPTTWVATYSALLLPAGLAFACADAAFRRRQGRAGTATALGLMGLLSLMTHSGFWKSVGLRYLRGESYVFLVLMILPWLGLVLFTYLASQRQAPAATRLAAAGDTSQSWSTGTSRPSTRQTPPPRLHDSPA